MSELERIQQSLTVDYEAGINPNSARAEKEALENNLAVVYPEDNQLQVDIDSDDAMNIFWAMLPIVQKYYGAIVESITASRSGFPKQHVTLRVTVPLNPFERIALQACLGSDRVREVLGVVQAMQGDPHPTLFLEKR